MDAQTALLLKKSADDAQALASRDLESLPDILGFHAQQAVEKLLKALLQEAGASYPWRHDIADLVTLVEQIDHPLPATPVPLARLTVFAVGYRYADMPSSETLNPGEARATVAILRQHVETRIDEIARAKQPPSSPA